MARLLVGAAFGVVVGMTLGAACGIRAEDLDRAVALDTIAAANEAGRPLVDVLGAADTMGMPARAYLISVGELASPAASPPTGVAPPQPLGAAPASLPIDGPLGRRLLCIERYESNHSASAVNRSSGARGWLQWLPSTARQWGVRIGDRQSEWNAAARIAALGERFFVSQWVPLQRGWC
jgi:hypothetical protein